MPTMERLALLLIASLALSSTACAARAKCFPAWGGEVWTERHLRVRDTQPPMRSLEIQLVADSSGPPAAGWSTIVQVARDTIGGKRIDGRVDATGRMSIPVEPGRYRVRLLQITYEPTQRVVEVGSDEEVAIEVQLRHAAYCVERVVVASARGAQRREAFGKAPRDSGRAA